MSDVKSKWCVQHKTIREWLVVAKFATRKEALSWIEDRDK